MVADALSKMFEDKAEDEMELWVTARPVWEGSEGGSSPTKNQEGLGNKPGFSPSLTLEHYCLHYKGRLVLYAQSSWISKFIAEYHVTPTGGYFGVIQNI